MLTFVRCRWPVLSLCSLVLVEAASVPSQAGSKRAEGAVHIPIRRIRTSRAHKRGEETAAIGLGDFLDVTYTVLLQVGEIDTPLILDTGSSDLWVISDACLNCITDLPLYPQAEFQSTGLNVELLYGDSFTGTHANGLIGRDVAGVAGLDVQNQFFAAIDDTNTSVLEVGAVGIFGLGFPLNSVIWSELFSASSSSSATSRRDVPLPDYTTHKFPDLNFLRPSFPNLPPISGHNSLSSRQQSLATVSDVLSSFRSFGPLVSRLVEEGQLAQPMVTITLQRDTVDIGGNVGQLSLGELPEGITNDSLTWVPLRAYTVDQGGLPAPADSPDEVYPIAWEIPIDNVYLDGAKLHRSTLSASNISLTALVDTGNSLIRGPQDVIASIFERLSGRVISCSDPHTLAFEIGGTLFPVDPRDFASQAVSNSIVGCQPNLAATDPPGVGFLYSWSLGDPFLKSALVSFYYGNLTYPSHDPPRMGLLSTVPLDAATHLREAVSAASSVGNLPATSDIAPSGTYAAQTTGVNGVPAARASDETGAAPLNSAGITAATPSLWHVALVIGALCWTILRS